MGLSRAGRRSPGYPSAPSSALNALSSRVERKSASKGRAVGGRWNTFIACAASSVVTCRRPRSSIDRYACVRPSLDAASCCVSLASSRPVLRAFPVTESSENLNITLFVILQRILKAGAAFGATLYRVLVLFCADLVHMWISNPNHSFCDRYSLRCTGVQGYAFVRKIGLKIRRPQGRGNHVSFGQPESSELRRVGNVPSVPRLVACRLVAFRSLPWQSLTPTRTLWLVLFAPAHGSCLVAGGKNLGEVPLPAVLVYVDGFHQGRLGE